MTNAKRNVGIVTAVLALGIVSGYAVRAARADGIPDTNALTYAGTLENTDGSPIAGAKEIQVALFEAASGGTPLCISSKVNQNVVGGHFEIALPDSCATAVKGNANAYAEVTVDGMVVGRSKIGAVPYAIEAGRASNATGALEKQLVPSGAVLAFDLDGCPPGWTELQAAKGRTVVGSNPGGANSLSARTRGQTIGEETHVMDVAELASHTHQLALFGQANTGFANNTFGLVSVGGQQVASNFGGGDTVSAGSAQPFNVMQPSLVLLYCKKD
jgi:hypothetical protein